MSADEDFRQELARQTFPDTEIVPLKVSAMFACDCGCGLPNRVEFRVEDMVLGIGDAVQIDQLVDKLAGAREKLWGPRPKERGRA
jgi:hypothetical protein